MYMQCCDVTYDVTAPFNDVTLANNMMLFGHAASKACPPKNCPKRPQIDKSTVATVHPERRVFRASPHIYVVPPQSWSDRSDTKHSKCLLLGGRRLNQLTLIPKPKGSGGARAATAQVGPANNRNDTKRCLPVEASLRPGEAVPW